MKVPFNPKKYFTNTLHVILVYSFYKIRLNHTKMRKIQRQYRYETVQFRMT